METESKNNELHLTRVLSVLDEFVLEFISLLEKLEIRYVLIAGYVALLFGRKRVTEDIDIFLEEMNEEKLEGLFQAVQKKYWIINARSLETARLLYREGIAWRVAEKGMVAPNMELKKPKDKLDFLSLNHALTVVLNKKYRMNIAPLELQIAYKFFLGTPKDEQDAQYIYDAVKDKIDKGKLVSFARELKVVDKISKLEIGE